MNLISDNVVLNAQSILYLVLFTLGLAIGGILLREQGRRVPGNRLLAAYFACGSGWAGSGFLVTSSFFSGWNLVQYTFMLLGGVFLLRFACGLPGSSPGLERETRLVRGAGWLIGTFGVGQVLLCPTSGPGFVTVRAVDLALLVLQFLGCVQVLLWKAVRLSRVPPPGEPAAPSSAGTWECIARPSGGSARMSRAYALALALPFLLAVWALLFHGVLAPLRMVSYLTYTLSLCLGCLAFVFTFVLTHLNYAPASSNLKTKILLSPLVTLFAVVGPLGQVLVSLHTERFVDRVAPDARQASSLCDRGRAADPREFPVSVAFVVERPGGSDAGVTGRAVFNRAGLSRDPLEVLNAKKVLLGPGFLARLTAPDGSRHPFFVTVAPSGGRDLWVGFPAREIHADLGTVGGGILVGMAGGVVLILMVFPAFFRIGLVEPLERLMAGVRQVEEGKLDVVVPVRYPDEIGFLTRAFNGMVASIGRMRSSLRDANAELEARVLERTAELSEANRRLERNAAEMEAANGELDAFAHTVAHDLKSPLTALVGYGSLLENCLEGMTCQEIRENLTGICQAGTKMTSIINELLLLAQTRKMETIPRKILDMSAVVSEALKRIAVPPDFPRPEILQPASWPRVLGYGPWVEEVWVNYLSNAVMYGGDPPVVELGWDPPADPAETPAGGDGIFPLVRFWVRDNGQGLTRDEQSRLFLPFTRLEQARLHGHGLGLSIVRRIVEKLGGKVGVDSWPGRGSIFFFTLPTVSGKDTGAAEA
ncbi:MAG: HAMP domain-containing histidine kinase [Acidobacteria bacterium]|nr:HAMP domain-containing histidine kinase [Acidobacteriota bacterium]